MEKEEEVQHETRKVNAQAQDIRIIRDDAKRELDKAMPEMRRALDAVNVLNKDDIDVIKTMPHPHESVILTMRGVFALMGLKNHDWKALPTACLRHSFRYDFSYYTTCAYTKRTT